MISIKNFYKKIKKNIRYFYRCSLKATMKNNKLNMPSIYELITFKTIVRIACIESYLLIIAIIKLSDVEMGTAANNVSLQA